MLDIDSGEDYLMESLKNFKPPEEKSMDKSKISALEQIISDKKATLNQKDKEVVAGVKIINMVDGNQDYDELMQLENTNFILDEVRFRKT